MFDALRIVKSKTAETKTTQARKLILPMSYMRQQQLKSFTTGY